MSLAGEPVWSNGNKTVTVRYKNWKWSDGQPVTSKDAEFFIDMTRAAVKASAPRTTRSTSRASASPTRS